MARKDLPLREVSIEELFISGEKSIYEIPIYQRNYAWEKDEITALVQDVYDAYKKSDEKIYYIGTLVCYHKGDQVFEIIDGQQRLTTISLILEAFDIVPQNKLTYRARKKSDDTLKSIPEFNVEEKDRGIENGFKYAKAAIGDIVPCTEKSEFASYFRNNVHIIHYRVPKDIDLNHYFEIMNSRGEQLEKHEIVKANLMEKLNTDAERAVFNKIWECCSEMNVYCQQNLTGINTEDVFGKSLDEFLPKNFEDVISILPNGNGENIKQEFVTIAEILDPKNGGMWASLDENIDKKDSFQPIIDFPNFLLIVLKITLLNREGFDIADFNLDDKELLNEFAKARMNTSDVKTFAYNLLKARFLLDNYVVHHTKEEDTMDSNPWKLQVWHKDEDTKKGQLKNLCTNDIPLQNRLVHLLSMFEVSFTPRQRKNYLFYCILYLLSLDSIYPRKYAEFVETLADRYFRVVYLDSSKLNAINTPLPGSFDEAIIQSGKLVTNDIPDKTADEFICVYGNGTEASKGVPLFIFNYLDYKLWKMYDEELRGEKLKKGSREREAFFARLGCSDFEQKIFDQFYFSRTRRSLEHYYPQANATGEGDSLSQSQINCIGNYAMIGSEANSSGSNYSPKTKLIHYLDSPRKISPISVASLKFMIMLQICRDKGKWEFAEIENHQKCMLNILLPQRNVET